MMVAGVGRGFGQWDLGAEVWISRDDDPVAEGGRTGGGVGTRERSAESGERACVLLGCPVQGGEGVRIGRVGEALEAEAEARGLGGRVQAQVEGGPVGVGVAVGNAVRASLVVVVVITLLTSLAIYGADGKFNLAG